MSLKSTILAFKVVQVVQIGGEGRGNLDKIQKNSNFFFRETFLMTLSYNLAYLETILVHPTRRQSFANTVQLH